MALFTGSATAMVTPFTENGEKINFEAFKKMVDFQIENKTSALVFLGTTGEPATMTQEEKISVIEFAVDFVKSRVPVIAGAGSNDTRSAIKNSQLYEKMGVNGLLHVTPYYNKCTQKGLVAHFSSVALHTSLPIILYNVPGRTGVNLLPQTIGELLENKNIVGVKEASGNIEQISEICKRFADKIDIYSGDDGIVLPVLSLGGKGVISVASNVAPKIMSELCESFFEGNIEKSRQLQFFLLPLIKALFSEVNPIPVKTALNLMGMNAGALRLPLTAMEEQTKEKLIIEMMNVGLIK